MAKFLNQTLNLTLAQMQAAGLTAGADFLLGSPLPLDCLISGYEIGVTQAVTGPGLTSANATITTSFAPINADMTIQGTYQNGGQQFVLTLAINGCYMNQLLTGAITAIIYYDRFTKTRFPISPV